MTQSANQSPTEKAVASPAIPVAAAVAALVAALGLKPMERRELAAFVDDLQRRRGKLPHVSLYAAATKWGFNYRLTYRVPGYRRRTERLGKQLKPAHDRAKRVSEILQQVKAKLLKPQDAYRQLYVDNTSIDRHLESFEASLKAAGVVNSYLTYTITRLKRVMQLGGFERLDDIRRASLPTVIEQLSAFVDPVKKQKLSASTINQYLAAFRQFTKWAKASGKIAEDPLQYTKGVRNNDRAKRRDVLMEELAEIVAFALAGEESIGWSGPDRAMLYLTAYATGLRRGELAAIDITWLKLDAKPPIVALPGKVTKNRKDAQQPLPTWIVEQLRAWLGDRKAGPLFTGSLNRAAEMFNEDRQGAREAWINMEADDKAPAERTRREREASDFLQRKTSDGEIVFHSLRHSYASTLVGSMDMRSAQLLTRHSTTAMLERYSHTRLAKAAAGVEQAIQQPKQQRKERR